MCGSHIKFKHSHIKRFYLYMDRTSSIYIQLTKAAYLHRVLSGIVSPIYSDAKVRDLLLSYVP